MQLYSSCSRSVLYQQEDLKSLAKTKKEDSFEERKKSASSISLPRVEQRTDVRSLYRFELWPSVCLSVSLSCQLEIKSEQNCLQNSSLK